MAKDKSYFGLDLPELLLGVATIMTIFSIVITIFDIVVYYSSLTGRGNTTMSNTLFTFFGALLYAYAAFQNFSICFAGMGVNIVDFFNSYNVIAFVAIICALIDGIRRFETTHMAIPLTFFSYSLVGFVCLFVTCIPSCSENDENENASQDVSEDLNDEQGTSGTSNAQNYSPIFNMPVHVKRENDGDWQTQNYQLTFKSQYN